VADLFVPDNHAPDVPVYAPVPDADAQRLRRWLRRHYGGVFSGREQVLALTGANINSSNFRVGDYYVKTLTQRASVDYVDSFPEIAARLRAGGVPCAEFVSNAEHAGVSRVEEGGATHFLYAQRFIDAHYFRGAPEEVDALLPLLVPMSGALAAQSPTPGQREPYASLDLRSTQEAVAAELPARPADPFGLNAVAALPEAMEIATEFEGLRPQLDFSRLHHFDLHPHNVLLQGGHAVAILDLESFRALPFEISVAFTLFKLGRKAVASGALSAAQFKARAAAHFDLGRLARYARIELARRITAVLSLHYLHDNRDWDPDLVKHLRGLREAQQLFGTG
jgi:Ser/Thr protein kinase RdoA (MazF antagonist)